MKKISTLSHYVKQEKKLYPLMILFSVILSLLKIHGSVINRDAIVYLSTAEAFLENGFSGSYQHYSWLPFAILGATLSKITNFSLENSFYTINTLLYAFIPVVFVRLYVVATNSKNALPIVALLALLLPAFNGYRDMIIRDVGFWFFSLLALLAFLRFYQTKTYFYALGWQLAVGIAFLFRFEAFVWIIGLPLCLLWIDTDSAGARCKHWLSSINLYLLFFTMTAVFLVTDDNALESLRHKIPSTEDIFNGLNGLKNAKVQMAQHVLNEYSEEYAYLILTAGLLTHLIYIVLSAVNLLYLILAATAFSKRCPIKYSFETGIIYWALTLTLLTLTAFVLHRQFMIERYTILAALLILLLISQPITQWTVAKWPQTSQRMKSSVCVLLVTILLSILISKNPPPTNLKSAGEWLQNNTTLDTPIALNDNRLLHYSGRIRQGITCVIERDFRVSLKSIDELKTYDYLVMQTKNETRITDLAPLDQDGSFEIVQEFSRGKSIIIIYKNIMPSSEEARDCNPFR